MKKIFLATVVFLAAGIMVYAQASNLPTTSQVRQDAQQYLTQARTNSSQFESTVNEQNTQSQSNKDSDTFNRFKAQIDRLEANIKSEQERLDLSLSNGKRANVSSMKRIQQLIEQHKAKMDELEAFIASLGTS